MTKTTEKILPDQAEKAQYVRKNFDDISRNYDSFNDWITFGMHRLWKRQVVDLAIGSTANPSCLDLCTGTGDIALLLWERGAKVTALDFSKNMLTHLKNKLGLRLNGTRPKHFSILQGDATNLSLFKKGTFNAVTVGFGLRNVTKREKCLKEVYRVLKPGGTFVVLETGKTIPTLRPFANFYFSKVVPRIGHWMEGKKHSMYDYLPASAAAYPSQEEFAKELLAAGFADIQIHNRMFGSASIHSAKKP